MARHWGCVGRLRQACEGIICEDREHSIERWIERDRRRRRLTDLRACVRIVHTLTDQAHQARRPGTAGTPTRHSWHTHQAHQAHRPGTPGTPTRHAMHTYHAQQAHQAQRPGTPVTPSLLSVHTYVRVRTYVRTYDRTYVRTCMARLVQACFELGALYLAGRVPCRKTVRSRQSTLGCKSTSPGQMRRSRDFRRSASASSISLGPSWFRRLARGASPW